MLGVCNNIDSQAGYAKPKYAASAMTKQAGNETVANGSTEGDSDIPVQKITQGTKSDAMCQDSDEGRVGTIKHHKTK